MKKDYRVEVSFPIGGDESEFKKNLVLERPEVEWLVLPRQGIVTPDVLTQEYLGIYPAKDPDSVLSAARHEEFLATIGQAFQGKPHTPESLSDLDVCSRTHENESFGA